MRNECLVFIFAAVIVVTPAFAQDNKNAQAQCAREVGIKRDLVGRRTIKWRDEAQHAAFMDCLSRKSNPLPVAAGKKPGGSRNSD